MREHVVLVNEKNEVLGISPKLNSHHGNTPLHRGFSVFLFNHKGELLLQKRSQKKKTWPSVWSNSCCGHPDISESSIDAAKRRLSYELGLKEAEIFIILPDYRYRVQRDGIVENEICPVMVGFTNQVTEINPEEVESIKWITWKDWLNEIQKNPENYSEWAVEESKLLKENKKFRHLLREATKKLKIK